jgi:glycosyltransferase involved in cell wall biosynthesis
MANPIVHATPRNPLVRGAGFEPAQKRIFAVDSHLEPRDEPVPMRLSVALCTYNGAAYLDAQLDSIARQTRLPDEIVVCDDGSNDGTLHKLSCFAERAKFPVRIVENLSRLGSTANFNNAIELCDGDIIVLSDQDDVWHIGKLAYIETAFAAAPDLGGLFTNGALIDGQGKSLRGSLWKSVGFVRSKQNSVHDNNGFEALLRGNFVTGATLAFRGSLKGFLLPIPVGWVHDYWLASLIAAASKLDCTETEFIHYRCHALQQLGVKRSIVKQWRNFLITDKTAYLAAERRWIDVFERLRRNNIHQNASSLEKCQAIASHMRRRSALPRQRFRRLPAILQDVVSGNYFRYSSGLCSILRDMIAR